MKRKRKDTRKDKIILGMGTIIGVLFLVIIGLFFFPHWFGLQTGGYEVIELISEIQVPVYQECSVEDKDCSREVYDGKLEEYHRVMDIIDETPQPKMIMDSPALHRSKTVSVSKEVLQKAMDTYSNNKDERGWCVKGKEIGSKFIIDDFELQLNVDGTPTSIEKFYCKGKDHIGWMHSHPSAGGSVYSFADWVFFGEHISETGGELGVLVWNDEFMDTAFVFYWDNRAYDWGENGGVYELKYEIT